MKGVKLVLLLLICILSLSNANARYYCNNLCWEQAQQLLSQGHYYLDGDSDGEACERSNPCGGGGNYNSFNSYSNSYKQTIVYRCPANAYETSDGGCRCKLGYKSNILNTSCEYDWEYHCDSKYPGTIFRESDKKCICPKGNPMGWDSVNKGCPGTDEDCQSQFGTNSYATGGYNKCGCKQGFVMGNTGCVSVYDFLDTYYNSSNKYSNSNKDSSWGLGTRSFIGLIGVLIYNYINKKNQQ